MKPHLSLYLISTSMTCKSLYAHLLKFVDENDRLMVVEFDDRPQYNRAFTGTNAWISKHFG